MRSKNYFIKDIYKPNKELLTLDSVSRETYWNANRIRASYIYQFPVYKYADSIIKKNNISTLIDIGCGVGSKLEFLKRKNPHLEIIGIDQKSAISYCKRKYKFGCWVEDDFEKKVVRNFYNNAPDLIICSDVIEHLLNPDILIEYIRTLATNSTRIIISTPNRDKLRGRGCTNCSNPHHIREWNSDEIVEYLKFSGFEIIDHIHQFPIKVSFNKFIFPEIIYRGLKFRPLKYNQVILLRIPGAQNN